MSRRIRLGMLTPSSNTTLEPITSAMIGGLPEVSAHFSRFPVTEISLREQALDQFAIEKILQGARLLADARVVRLGPTVDGLRIIRDGIGPKDRVIINGERTIIFAN